jgi:hypothetical protein
MQPLIIDSTNLTPSVEFNPTESKFIIAGYSRPEDVSEFYFPLINWIREYKKHLENSENKAKNHTFIFKFSYFNSASTKYLCDLLLEIKKLRNCVLSLDIDWYYEEYDDDMREVGETLSEIINYPFNFYSFEKD